MLTAPADFALDFAAVLLLNYATVNLDCLLSIEIIFTVFVILSAGAIACLLSGDSIALLDWRCTPIDYTSSFQVTVCRLLISSEVFHTEFQPAQFDNVTSLEAEIVQK